MMKQEGLRIKKHHGMHYQAPYQALVSLDFITRKSSHVARTRPLIWHFYLITYLTKKWQDEKMQELNKNKQDTTQRVYFVQMSFKPLQICILL